MFSSFVFFLRMYTVNNSAQDMKRSFEGDHFRQSDYILSVERMCVGVRWWKSVGVCRSGVWVSEGYVGLGVGSIP